MGCCPNSFRTANDVNILKEIRMLRISKSNTCCSLFPCLWRMFLLLRKAYCIFPYSASIRTNLLLRVILVYPLSHGLFSLHRAGPVNDPGMSDWLGPPPLAPARGATTFWRALSIKCSGTPCGCHDHSQTLLHTAPFVHVPEKVARCY